MTEELNQNTDVDAPPADPPQDPPVNPAGLTEEQAKSWFGRIAATQIDRKVLPLIQEQNDQMKELSELIRGSRGASKPTEKLDEELQTMILEGNVTGALEKYQSIKKQTDENLSAAKIKELNKLIVAHSEDPLYEDIHGDMEAIAKQKINDGWPPSAAVDHAKTAAEAKYYRAKINGDAHDGLEMSSGGRPAPRGKKKGLPEIYKKACERDIADGIFKDEADYIKSLPLQTRKQYGL